MFFLSLETSTVAFRTVLDELALNLTSFQYFCQESFFFAFLFAFQRKFGPKIPAKIPRNRLFSPRICLFKSREISLFFPRIIRSPGLKGGGAQYGGFLGMLASIGVPLALDLVRKIIGKGMQTQPPPPPPRTRRSPGIPKGKGMQIQPPPFYGTWEDYYRLKKN